MSSVNLFSSHVTGKQLCESRNGSSQVGKRKQENSTVLTQQKFVKTKHDEVLGLENTTGLSCPVTEDTTTRGQSSTGTQVVAECAPENSTTVGTRNSYPQRGCPSLGYGGSLGSIEPKSPKKLTQNVVYQNRAQSNCCRADRPCPRIWTVDRNSAKQKRYYGVRRGRTIGIFLDWPTTERQVTRFRGAIFKSFKSPDAVEKYMNIPPAGCSHTELDSSHNYLHDHQTMEAGLSSTLDAHNTCVGCKVPLQDKFQGSFCNQCAPINSLNEVPVDLKEVSHLSLEQSEILRLVMQGHNIFFTGAAGTGKSTVLKAIVCHLRAQMKKVQTVAPTGIAALPLGGTTIHAYAGWNIRTGKTLPLTEMEANAHNKRTWKRPAQCTDVLIIDEISMVENFTFARLDRVMRSARNSEKPFGGAQVIVTGDFYQLPPVRPFETCLVCGSKLQGWQERLQIYTCPEHGEWRDSEKWAFQSGTWSECNFVHRELKQVHRQADKAFIVLLGKIRNGEELTDEERKRLLGRDMNLNLQKVVRIYPHRSKVDSINSDQLDRLKTLRQAYSCSDGFRWLRKQHPELEWRFDRVKDDDAHSPLLAFHEERHRFSDELVLKEGMPVLLLINLSFNLGLINGSRGQIIGFEKSEEKNLPRVRRNDADDRGKDIALSFKTVYEKRQVHSFASRERIKRQGWPIVRFENGVQRTIYPRCSVTELGSGPPFSVISRTQIPLAAAWAITVHKSQGMTIGCAVIDMDRAWEHGQSYVAMSRAKSLEGLVVHGLASGKVTGADGTVKSFMARFRPHLHM